MNNLTILFNAKRWLFALRSIMSSIGSMCDLESSGVSLTSMRHIPAALSTVSSVGCILKRFFPNVPCARYVVAVSSCSCNVSGWSFSGSSISTVRISVNFVSGFPLGSFLSLCVVLVSSWLMEEIGSFSFRFIFPVVARNFRALFRLESVLR